MSTTIDNIISLNDHLHERGDYLVQYYRENGQRAVVLKGQSLRSYYPTPYERHCGDIDLWLVPEPGVSLSKHRKKVLHDLKEMEVSYTKVIYHHVDAHFYQDAAVELHFTPAYMYNPILNCRLQKWFTTQHEELDYRIYLTVHMFRHLFSSGIIEKQREDLRRVIEKDGEADKLTLQNLGLWQFYMDITQWENPLSTIRPWHYPRERFWKQPWRICHFIWRKLYSLIYKF